MSAETSITIELIAKTHPRNMKPIAAERAICMAMERLLRKMSEAEAFSYLLARTQLYAECVKAWPEEDRKFGCESHTWFANACFEPGDGSEAAARELWQPKGGNSANGHSAAQANRDEQSSRIRQAADRLRKRANGENPQSLPGKHAR